MCVNLLNGMPMACLYRCMAPSIQAAGLYNMSDLFIPGQTSCKASISGFRCEFFFINYCVFCDEHFSGFIACLRNP